MCEYEADGVARTRIDQALYEATRRIERQMAGPPASEAA